MASKHFAVKTIDVSLSTAFAAAPDVTIDFEPEEILIWHSGTAGAIEYSFDGTNVHGVLTLGEPTESMVETCTDRNIWFRRQTAGAGTATAQVSASRK